MKTSAVKRLERQSCGIKILFIFIDWGCDFVFLFLYDKKLYDSERNEERDPFHEAFSAWGRPWYASVILKYSLLCAVQVLFLVSLCKNNRLLAGEQRIQKTDWGIKYKALFGSLSVFSTSLWMSTFLFAINDYGDVQTNKSDQMKQCLFSVRVFLFTTVLFITE